MNLISEFNVSKQLIQYSTAVGRIFVAVGRIFYLRVPFVAQYPLPASKIFSYSGRGLSIFSYVISRNISKSENFEIFLLQRYDDTYKWKNVYLPKLRMKKCHAVLYFDFRPLSKVRALIFQFSTFCYHNCLPEKI